MWQALAGFLAKKVGDKNQQGSKVDDTMSNGIQNVGSNLEQLDWNNAMQFPEYKGFGGF